MKIFSDISIWWILPLLAISILLSFLYYRNQAVLKDISKLIKLSLISLRALTIFTICLLLLGLIIETKDYKTEKPLFITMIDNSKSMLNYGDSDRVNGGIQEFNKKLSEQFGERFEIKQFFIGENVEEDGLDFQDDRSNLNEGFDFIYNQYYNRNIGGVCFVSDGNYNTGKNPIYSAERISLTPVFTVGVGDTIVKRDHLIRNVAVNDVAFLNNEFPIEVDVEARKLGKVESSLSLWQGDKKIAEEKINYVDGNLDFVSVSFQLEAQSIGFKNYTVKLNKESRESSYENNERSFFVEVIDSRTKVLMLSDAPHPDITAIKQVIDGGENMEAKSQLIGDWDGKIEGYNMLIWQVSSSVNSQLTDAIEKYNIPVLYLLNSYSSSRELQTVNRNIVYPTGNRSDEIQGAIAENFQLFEVSDNLKKALLTFPPLNAKFGTSGLKGGKTLVKQRIGGVVKQDPLIAFGSESRNKSCVIFGEGLWRWRLTNYSRFNNHEAFNELIQKTLQYLTVKKNQEPLRVNLPKRFNEIDDIIINAEFYNSSFEPIITPDISLALKDDRGEEYKYTLAKNQKDYTVSLGKLQEGAYSWTASTSFEGKTYSKQGIFVVENTSLESIATHADHNLLQQIATKTSGRFYELTNMNSMLRDIEARKDIANITYEESNFKDLIDWKLLFVLLIIFLGLEWFLRRYNGSY